MTQSGQKTPWREIPNSKPQIPGKLQISIFKKSPIAVRWNLEFENSLELGAWDLVLFSPPSEDQEKICDCSGGTYLSRSMPKSIARRKTKKAVAKRFKITGRGKVLRAQSSRRHLLSSKNAKRRRQLGKAALVDPTDVARIKANLPFG
jgi:large subunit ribosomal protein L35